MRRSYIQQLVQEDFAFHVIGRGRWKTGRDPIGEQGQLGAAFRDRTENGEHGIAPKRLLYEYTVNVELGLRSIGKRQNIQEDLPVCGRYWLDEPMAHYLRELGGTQQLISYVDPAPIDRYNIAPSSRVPVICTGEDALTVDFVPWGWEPFWAKGKRRPSFNAHSETVASSKLSKSFWPQGRVLVPANLWFEWVKNPADTKKKQPYAIRLKSQRPMFFDGLAQIHPGAEPHDNNGMVIITDASDEGMVDVHDRRPVVLDPEQARAWIAGELRSESAEVRLHENSADQFQTLNGSGSAERSAMYVITVLS